MEIMVFPPEKKNFHASKKETDIPSSNVTFS